MRKDQELKQNETIITFEQIMAGALLKFVKLDNVDVSILLEDFIALDGIKVNTSFDLKNLSEYMYIYQKNGCISLFDERPFEYFIQNENRNVRDKYIEVAGNIVIDYFSKLDIEEFKKRKIKLVQEQKEALLREGNILLITDSEEDYNEIIKYGFKNVDYFKSIIRADEYFKRHPKQLEKYHVIIKGHQYVENCCLNNSIELEKKFWDLSNKGKVIYAQLSSYRHIPNDHYFINYFRDFKNLRSWDTKDASYSEALDRIVENALVNHILELVDLKGKKIEPFKDYINPNRLPLPKKKSDLKILYLDSISVNKHAKEISQRLGLNITFKEDSNSGLGKYIINHLGEYDIIIVSSLYSSSILWMNNESTEQCKDTGRELTLLVTYKDDKIWQFDEDGKSDLQGIGSKIDLYYSYGGTLTSIKETRNKTYRVLRESPSTREQDYWSKYEQSRESNMQSIISSAVNLYNEALLESTQQPLYDIDVKTAEEYDIEYDKVEQQENARKQQALEPIHIFDNFKQEIMYYLRYKKQGLISDSLDNLKITETEDGICIENTYQGRTLCSIILSKKNKKDNLRIFSIQTLTKKGKLGNHEVVGLYTRKYEGLEGTPNRPNEIQMNAFLATKKKIDAQIAPLNKQAFEKSIKKDKSKKRRLEKATKHK